MGPTGLIPEEMINMIYMKNLEERNKELTAKLMTYYNLEAEYDYLKECNMDLATHIRKLENKIDELKKKNDELDKENEELYNKNKELEKEKDRYKGEVEELGGLLDEYGVYY